MTFTGFVFFLLIGLLAGWVAGLILGVRGGGWLWRLVVGVAGSFLGGFLLSLLGFVATTPLARLISAVLGAVLLLVAVGRLGRRR